MNGNDIVKAEALIKDLEAREGANQEYAAEQLKSERGREENWRALFWGSQGWESPDVAGIERERDRIYEGNEDVNPESKKPAKTESLAAEAQRKRRAAFRRTPALRRATTP